MMPKTGQKSGIQHQFNENTEFCHTFEFPVLLQKNRRGNPAVMANTQHETFGGKQKLADLLEEGLRGKEEGPGKEATLFFVELGEQYGF